MESRPHRRHKSTFSKSCSVMWTGPGGGGVKGEEGALPYKRYIGMCGPKGYGFQAVWVINRVMIRAILVMNRVWFAPPA